MKQTIIAVVIALLAIIFALKNAQIVTVRFYFWDLSCSMALLLLVTLVIGIAAGMLTLSPGIYKRNSTISKNKKKIAELEKQLSANTNKNFQ